MDTLIPGFIMGFREGLEAFLIIAIVLQYLNVSKQTEYKGSVYQGTLLGIIASLGVGALLYGLSKLIEKTDEVAKIWESGASLIAVILITFFIVWMIKHGKSLVNDVQNQVRANLSKTGLFSLAAIMVLREGTEIAIFTFAGKYALGAILLGIGLALILALLIYKALIKINLSLLFNITLAYLILQAGFLAGYAIHEALSALVALGYLGSDHLLLIKAYDLSGTILYHKEGLLGLPLYVAFGWTSKPEWIQLLIHAGYAGSLFHFWRKTNKTR